VNLTVQGERFRNSVNRFRPERFAVSRSLALFSAAIALCDDNYTEAAIRRGLEFGADRARLYEIVLQSYLFLGFPRMLAAAECLDRAAPPPSARAAQPRFDPREAETWLQRGGDLCKKVYGRNFVALRDRVTAMAPEIFQWMVLEGYGKVLSRPGLDSADRETAIVACLMMENRASQLHSHLRGAINVGAPIELLFDVIADIGDAAGDGYREAVALMHKLDRR